MQDIDKALVYDDQIIKGNAEKDEYLILVSGLQETEKVALKKWVKQGVRQGNRTVFFDESIRACFR